MNQSDLDFKHLLSVIFSRSCFGSGDIWLAIWHVSTVFMGKNLWVVTWYYYDLVGFMMGIIVVW